MKPHTCLACGCLITDGKPERLVPSAAGMPRYRHDNDDDCAAALAAPPPGAVLRRPARRRAAGKRGGRIWP